MAAIGSGAGALRQLPALPAQAEVPPTMEGQAPGLPQAAPGILLLLQMVPGTVQIQCQTILAQWASGCLPN